MSDPQLSHVRAYLAGPMELTSDNGESWRNPMANWLRLHGATVYDPAAKKNESIDETARLRLLRDAGAYDALTQDMRAIRESDLELVCASNLVIAHLDENIPSTGTLREIFMARDLGRDVIIHMEQGLKRIPLWLFAEFDYHSFSGEWSGVMYLISSRYAMGANDES